MASFYTYLPKLQKVEGGYQNNPNDGGNYNSLGQNVGTNYGISAGFYEDIIGRPPSVADIKAITPERAKQLFKVYFWDKNLASQIKNQSLAETVIDHQINSGNGVRIAQQLLNNVFGKNLAVDNQIGQQTLAALNSVNPKVFVDRYNEERAEWYKTRSNSSTFAAGWLIRLKDFAYKHQNKIVGGYAIVILGVGFLCYKILKEN